MVEEKVLVLGLGQIGLPLHELLKEHNKFLVYGFDVDESKMRGIGHKTVPDEVDVMHVCIPSLTRDEFADFIVSYVKRFYPKLVIINSTVPPGTTEEIHKRCNGCHVAHSPVRGVQKISSI